MGDLSSGLTGTGGVPNGLVYGVAADAEDAGAETFEVVVEIGVGCGEDGLMDLAFVVGEPGEGWT